MAVIINFGVNGSAINEVNPLDFGIVQAGTSSAIKVVTVANSGSSDALLCSIEPVEASVVNGFSIEAQTGTAQETYQSQQFASDVNSQFYGYAVMGAGKNYAGRVGGTIAATNGQDTYATKWTPPSLGNAGVKVWGCRFSCVYI